MATHTSAERLQCVVVTPETTLIDRTVDFVAVPLYDGELGIAPGRAPLIGRLGYGELRTRDGEATNRFFIDSGFVQVANNVVSVLTPRAIPAEQINVEAARQELQAALAQTPNSPETFGARDLAVARARARIRVASSS